ncbi:MAG: flagellar protein export ATPase FliI [Alphaproteobacteria bacterium]|nr:flagellar protein export ATPase FliI [Alphaproteobacteria bacterium]
MSALKALVNEISEISDVRIYGRVTAVLGMMIEVGGMSETFSIGDLCSVIARDDRKILCEITGFRDGNALMMPFQPLEGVGLGCKVYRLSGRPTIRPHRSWLGRVVNALGEPIDGKGPLPQGMIPQPLRVKPPPAHRRKRVGGKIDLGIRALNTFVTCCRGQRMGVFAASGVGKSVMQSMVARFTSADVNVIGLVGERGREVQEFLHNDLGPEGLARSVVFVATSDESALMRRQAADMTLAIAEFFRDQDADVLCMIDSITRVAMAQREIGLSMGEPPANKGYTPTVFAELPKLLERAGPGEGEGTITGLFSVLVEGDDHDEPIADAVRSILDGHIVLERAIAERGRYPAINILRSVSRTMPDCNSPEETALITRVRSMVSRYEDMAEMIRLGAYQAGSDPATDEAIYYRDQLEAFLSQTKEEQTDIPMGFEMLAEIVNGETT